MNAIARRSAAVLLTLSTALTAAACVAPSAAPVAENAPRETVVVLHGLGRSASAMAPLSRYLETAGYRVHNIEYSSMRSSPDEILADVTRQIDACCTEHRGPVHFVGHSLGGLLARAYLQEHNLADLGRVVAIGSPAKGTAIVDRFRGKWWFDLFGPMTAALGTGESGFAARLEQPSYPLGVIAGHKDYAHTDWIPGADDGLVAVESTKVDGMADFLLVPAGHAGLRRDETVARQTVNFLRTGRFERAEAVAVAD